MFEQYKDFFEIVFIGVILASIFAVILRGVINDHFIPPIIENDPQPEAEIIILDEHRNNKKNYLKNNIIMNIKNDGYDKKYIFIDKSDDLYKKNIS